MARHSAHPLQLPLPPHPSRLHHPPRPRNLVGSPTNPRDPNSPLSPRPPPNHPRSPCRERDNPLCNHNPRHGAHHLAPQPRPRTVDVQDDATVSPASVAALLTPKTKAILVAQLFGARHDLQDVAALARREGVLFIEDCAQAFIGREWTGSPCADVSLFSFGPIKTATALGGALVTVRRPELLGKMREVQARYPQQSEGVFAKRVLKYAVLKAVADSKWLYGVFVAGLVVVGDVHGTITRLGRTLRPGDIRAQIRVQPSAALLDLLMYRLQSFDPRGLERRERVKRLVGRLPGGVHPVGFEKQQHHYWICPIRVKSPGGVISGLWREGFDSADGGTSLCVVGAGGGGVDVNGEKRPKMAEDMMRRVVYLPIDHEFDDHELERLAGVLAESAGW